MADRPFNPMIEKLRKLIAHEQSARSIGNISEAEAFAAKIQDLLTAHKLSMSEVEFQEREDGEPIDWELVDGDEVVGRSKRFRSVYWRVKIAQAIAKVNSCQCINQRRSNGKNFFFVGRTSDRELAKILYIYMIELGEELSNKAARENREIQTLKFRVDRNILDSEMLKLSWVKPALNQWLKEYRESWKTGFGDAIQKRLIDQYEATIRASVATNAIIHIKRDALAVEDYLKGKIHSAHTHLRKSDSNDDGYEHGQNTGKAVNLTPHRFKGASGRAARLLGA